MLFPMMEHMDETPNGAWSWFVCNYLMSAAAASALRLLLPEAALRHLVRRHLARDSIQYAFLKSSRKFSQNPNLIWRHIPTSHILPILEVLEFW